MCTELLCISHQEQGGPGRYYEAQQGAEGMAQRLRALAALAKVGDLTPFTRQLTEVCNPSSTEFHGLFWPPRAL